MAASESIPFRAFAHPMHHCLIAAYFPVWLLSNNATLFDLSDAFRPVVLSVAIALLIFFSLRWIYRSPHKAAVATSAAILLLYCFALVRESLAIGSPGSVAMLLLGIAFLGVAGFTFRSKRIGETTSKIFNGFAIALFMLPVLKVASYSSDAAAHFRPATSDRRLAESPVTSRPTIIHIVLDGYSRADVLKEVYGHDNAPFIGALRDAGFVVADRATTPYSQTLLSMNAVFGLGYINERVETLAKTMTMEEVRTTLTADLDRSLLVSSLRSIGYPVVTVESLYKGIKLTSTDQMISSADERLGLSYFETVLMHYTPVERLIVKLGLDDATYSKTRFALSAHDLSTIKAPFFLYNHIIAPHPPFNMMRDGDFRPETFGMGDGSEREKMDAAWYEDYRTGYLEKLRYTNKSILAKIQRIKEQVPDPKIIVIHSDHGGGMYLHKENKAATCAKERMSNFLAVYSSDAGVRQAIHPDMNLVNLYRTIFREGFGADFPSLPSRNYFAPWSHPEQLTLVSADDLGRTGPTCTLSGEPVATRYKTPPEIAVTQKKHSIPQTFTVD